MKRGLITWDHSEIAPQVFELRVEKVRDALAARGLPALVIYSDLWRSNRGRFFSNFMPYFNRALLILPLEGKPTLLCGLSPRVYNWIRSVTTIEDVRPAGNFSKPLFQLAEERGWKSLGVLDAEQLPYDMAQALQGGPFEIAALASEQVLAPEPDDTEIAMRRKAVTLLRSVLEEELKGGRGEVDYRLVGRLERVFRRAGAEDLIVLVTNGAGPPGPATGSVLEDGYSVSIALEYRGHWVRVTRPRASAERLAQCKAAFLQTLANSLPGADGRLMEDLGGGYPYECNNSESIFALHIRIADLHYGDTCRHTSLGPEIL